MYLRRENAPTQACRRDLVRNIPLGARDRWCQGLAESMRADGGVVDRGSKSVERGMSWRVDSGVERQDVAVDGQCL